MTFWEWFSGQVTPNTYEEIQDSYKFINTMLLQKCVLKQPIFLTTEKSKLVYALTQTKKVFANTKIRFNAIRLLSAYIEFLDMVTPDASMEEKDIPVSESQVKTNNEQLTASYITNESRFDGSQPNISANILSAIHDLYSSGLRFEDTVIRLLEEKSNETITENMKQVLKEQMFCRSDEVYFLPDTILTIEQQKIINKEVILDQVLKFGCIDLKALWNTCYSNGNSTCLRNAEDLEKYLNYLLHADIRIGNGLKTRIVHKIGKSVSDSLAEAANKVVQTIKDYGCITEEDLLQAYPVFTSSFLKELLEKYTDEVLPTVINEFLCYQTFESMGIDEGFSEAISMTLEELDRLSICPSQETLHALLSVKLGYNVRNEYSIPDDKTFRRFIAVYYFGSEYRTWKAGNFVGVNIDNV